MIRRCMEFGKRCGKTDRGIFCPYRHAEYTLAIHTHIHAHLLSHAKSKRMFGDEHTCERMYFVGGLYVCKTFKTNQIAIHFSCQYDYIGKLGMQQQHIYCFTHISIQKSSTNPPKWKFTVLCVFICLILPSLPTFRQFVC